MKKVRVLIGNMFESKAQTLVNTVNCVGVMGKGVALEFKKRFPQMYEDYAKRCAAGQVRLGQPYLHRSEELPWILNFPTKGHWRAVTRLEDIVKGFEHLLAHYKEWGITSLAVPPLGCGQGQLEWRVVGPTLYRYLNRMDIPIELYAPYGTQHEELTPEFLQGDLFKRKPNMPDAEWVQPSWVALVEILARLERQPYHPWIGRTYFQKIAYVATAEGIPTGLKFEKGSFGPFASGLKPLISRLLNNGLVREEQSGAMFHVSVGPTYLDARVSYEESLKQWEPIISNVADVFMRMDTQQAEIAATVLFSTTAMRDQGIDFPSERQVFDYVTAWKLKRRPPLEASDIALGVRNLAALGLVKLKASSDLPLPDEEAVDA